ncbi:MAG: aminodeoxychorismate/anthranilate synthase component II [Desulfobacterales bacterium]
MFEKAYGIDAVLSGATLDLPGPACAPCPRCARAERSLKCAMKKLLVIDNYDSFTYNLVQLFMRCPVTIDVHRSDTISIPAVETKRPDYILISPGPRDPAHAGISVALVQRFFDRIPILGVCLGMQCINEAFGGTTIRSPLPVHGKTSMVSHTGRGLFAGMPSPFTAARYHSLMTRLDSSGGLEVTSVSEDGVIMGLSHFRYPVHGVQFHPESFMTEHGFLLVQNFLNPG